MEDLDSSAGVLFSVLSETSSFVFDGLFLFLVR